jgi:ADP-ribose pyrophosphatase YjhB (NUDIX family)
VVGFYFRDPDPPTPNPPRRVGAAALIEHGNALLLDRRIDPPGWALVAGTVDEDESVLDALRREIREETGLNVGSPTLFGVFSDPSRIVRYSDGNTYRTVTIAFLVKVDHVEALRPSDETAELRFVPKDELGNYEVIATHRPIVDLYLRGEAPPHVD